MKQSGWPIQTSRPRRWFERAVGGTVTIPWSSFWGGVADPTQGCWNAGGVHPPTALEISQVELLVPGGNNAPVGYSFCLQGVAQAA